MGREGAPTLALLDTGKADTTNDHEKHSIGQRRLKLPSEKKTNKK